MNNYFGKWTDMFVKHIREEMLGSPKPVVEYVVPHLTAGNKAIIEHKGKVWVELEANSDGTHTLRLNTITNDDIMGAIDINET